MAWIKQEANVEVAAELDYENDGIQKTNAYKAEITECRLAESQDEKSKSMSLVVGIKTEDGETAKTYFTIMGRDGNTYFESTYKGKTVKKQHFGLSIANTLFEIALGKEIFDCEPEDVEFERWDKEEKEMVKDNGQGFPEMIGKVVGVCVQMHREISGTDSKEFSKIEHFFDDATGLFSGEEAGTTKTKLDKWLGSMKEFKVTEKEAQNKSSFGGAKKEATDGEEPVKSRWGK